MNDNQMSRFMFCKEGELLRTKLHYYYGLLYPCQCVLLTQTPKPFGRKALARIQGGGVIPPTEPLRGP